MAGTFSEKVPATFYERRVNGSLDCEPVGVCYTERCQPPSRVMAFKISPRLTAIGLALLLCLRAGVALAQTLSLVELAQKEQERRKTLKGTAASKVYSDKDLPKTGTPANVSSLPPATPTPIPDEKPPEAKPTDQKDEAWWRTRMLQAREAQRRAEMFAEALQSRINGLTTDVVNRDDPYQRETRRRSPKSARGTSARHRRDRTGQEGHRRSRGTSPQSRCSS